MQSCGLILGLLLVGQTPPASAPASISAPSPETAADAVTLRDGARLFGQLADSSTRGPLVMYVRRAWAEEHLPDRARRWEEAETPTIRGALKLRRERLAAWRRERVAEPGGADPIARWLEDELERLGTGEDRDLPRAPLLVVTLDRSEVKGVVRRPKAAARMLRQGWLAGFADVESMKPDALKEALQGRGFAVPAAGEGPVNLDRLLPLLPETDAQWLTRRAATEVVNDPGLRFLQIQDIVLPEPYPGQPLKPEDARAMLGGLAPLLEGKPADPLATQLRAVEARGRVGAVLTRQEMSPAPDAVRITIGLFVRNGGTWSPAAVKSASVRTDALRPGDGSDLARDPQVAAVFRVFESVGFGFSPEVRQRSLNIGAATRKALGLARSAFTDRLNELALPLEAGGAAGGAAAAAAGRE
jgi:hypothetical protein